MTAVMNVCIESGGPVRTNRPLADERHSQSETASRAPRLSAGILNQDAGAINAVKEALSYLMDDPNLLQPKRHCDPSTESLFRNQKHPSKGQADMMCPAL